MTRPVLAALALGLATPLASCGADAPPATAGSTIASARIGERIADVERRLHTGMGFFDLLLAPFVPQARLDQVRAIEARVSRALALARSAASQAERLRQVRAAEAAADELEAVN